MTLPLLAAILSGRDDDPSSRPLGRAGRGEPSGPVDRAPRDEADRALLDRIRAGDVAAYESVFRAYFAPLSDFCESIVGSSEAAEEVVQEILWSLWERRATLDVHESFRAYLFSAVRYRALNDVRNHKRRADLLARDAAAVEPAEASDAERTTEVADLVAHLRRVIATLPESRQHVLALRWDHGLSYAEIAVVVGSSVKAVEVQLNRTLNQLRDKLLPLIG